MRAPPARNGGPGHHPDTAAAHQKFEAATKQLHTQTSATRRHEPPIAVGELHPPAGRRHLWVLLVRRCPACAHLHIHRVGRPSAGTHRRTGSCGADYEIRVVGGAA